MKNRNTLVFISNAINRLEKKCSFARELQAGPSGDHFGTVALHHSDSLGDSGGLFASRRVERWDLLDCPLERERWGGQRRSVVRWTSTEDGCTSNHLPDEEKFIV